MAFKVANPRLSERYLRYFRETDIKGDVGKENYGSVSRKKVAAVEKIAECEIKLKGRVFFMFSAVAGRTFLRQTDGKTHEQTIICGQLFTDHVVGSRPMERKRKPH